MSECKTKLLKYVARKIVQQSDRASNLKRPKKKLKARIAKLGASLY